MKRDFLNLLRCPNTGQHLEIETECDTGEVQTGWLVSENGNERYPIRNGIPRFVPEENYAGNFGMQWSHFRRTQLDSFSRHPISANRFKRATGWSPEDLDGKWVLDVGCGSGRFAEIALSYGAKVVALDYSIAVDACYENLKQNENLHIVQGDIYALPFSNETFPFVYSLGVLQHTPDVGKAIAALPAMVCRGGQLCVDVYWKRIRTMLHMKYLIRPLTTRISKNRLFFFLEHTVPFLLAVSKILGRVPVIGRFLKRLIPVADYTGVYPLDKKQLREWALLDTFDMLGPEYDNPQTSDQLKRFLEFGGITNIEIFQEGMLVGRGYKEI